MLRLLMLVGLAAALATTFVYVFTFDNFRPDDVPLSASAPELSLHQSYVVGESYSIPISVKNHTSLPAFLIGTGKDQCGTSCCLTPDMPDRLMILAKSESIITCKLSVTRAGSITDDIDIFAECEGRLVEIKFHFAGKAVKR